MKKIYTSAIFTILIGTILEWYDFSLIGLMAPIIANLFFPSKSSIISLLETFGIFAFGFLARPIGGFFFGHVGDKHGRKSALSKTIIWMALPTTLIGLLPTFNSIGILSPLLLVLLRFIQGFASSGEYPGAICYLAEIAPAAKRGLWSSLSMFGVGGGLLLSSVLNLLLWSYLSAIQMKAWGWRIPFLIGLPLGIVGWYFRYRLTETEIFQLAVINTKTLALPIREIIRFNMKSLLKAIMLFSLGPVSFYLGFVYIDAYLVNIKKISLHVAMVNNVLSTLILILFIPCFGYLSDKINRKYIVFAGAVCLLIFFYPIFILFFSGPKGLLVGQILLAVFIAMFVGPMAAVTSEIFPTFVRYSGLSIGLNIGASIFGGTCPLIATYMVQQSGSSFMPCIYPMIFAFLCLLIVCNLRNKQKHHFHILNYLCHDK